MYKLLMAAMLTAMGMNPVAAATWQDLQIMCEGASDRCDLYMMGVMEGLVLANAAAGSSEPLERYCIPAPGISYETFKAAVDKLLRDQPKARTFSAGAIGHIALAREFGC